MKRRPVAHDPNTLTLEDGDEWIAKNANETFTHRHIFRIGRGVVHWHYGNNLRLRSSLLIEFRVWIYRRSANLIHRRLL
jgi:hypothetical protein